MSSPERRTQYRWSLVATGAAVAAVGAASLGAAISKWQMWPSAMEDLGVGLIGWGPLVLIAKGFTWSSLLRHQAPLTGMAAGGNWAIAGGILWLAGCGLIAAGIRRSSEAADPPSAAVGAALYPPLKAYRDFHWLTLLAYGGGILGAELLLIILQTLLAGGVRVSGAPASVADRVSSSMFQLSPLAAFGIALSVACIVAFAAGFVGASRSRRLSAPEATIGFIYFGLPIPLGLTLLGFVPALQLSPISHRLREVLYLAALLGNRPEVGYWLVFGLLVLMMELGITSGFVATASGQIDLRTGFERYIARRHVAVFRPRLLLGLLAVLMFGVVPPLIIYAFVSAAGAAVEKNRIRLLGLKDPLLATAALNEAKIREQSPTEMMTALSVGGVGVGVMALIIVLSVMSGFEEDLQKKILGTHAHAIVLTYNEGFPDYREAMAKVKTVPGVVGLTPFIMNEVMISSEGNISGTVIKGIDPATVGDVTDVPRNILPGGSIEYLLHPEKIPLPGDSPGRLIRDKGSHGLSDQSSAKPDPDDDLIRPQARTLKQTPSSDALPGLLIGKELAASLRVMLGDRVNVVSPIGELGPQGPMPKSRPFRVAGIFYSGMYEYDSKLIYIRLEEAQSFFGVAGATGIELKVADIDDARRISKAVLEKLDGYPYRTKDWGEMNKNLFSALRLEKLVMGIILSIIVIVAAGLIVATVIMLVLEKRKEISVLKALGVSDGGIVKIFLAEGLQIGIAGGLLGLFSGLAWCVFIEKVGLKLDPEVYYIPALPVKIEPLQTGLSVLIAVLVTYLGSIYPALKASRVEPVEGLKAE